MIFFVVLYGVIAFLTLLNCSIYLDSISSIKSALIGIMAGLVSVLLAIVTDYLLEIRS